MTVNLVRRIRHRVSRLLDFSFYSSNYWERRYQRGLDSGPGSYGRLAEFKAKFLNAFVRDRSIQDVLEFGVGDGHQLSLAVYPKYCGIDVSETAIRICRDRFTNDPTKTFFTTAEDDQRLAELVLSLDVLYHLVEQSIFETYMRTLFQRASRFVVIYAADRNDNPYFNVKHVKFRKFTDWIADNQPQWILERVVPNEFPYDLASPEQTSFADFFVFAKRG